MRLESDSMGPIAVPSNRYWGAQTQRALDNFEISGQRFPRGFIQALGQVMASLAILEQDRGRVEMARALFMRAIAADRDAGHLPAGAGRRPSPAAQHLDDFRLPGLVPLRPSGPAARCCPRSRWRR